MATLAGSTIASTYTYLLKMDGTSGVTSSLVKVEDGDATDTALSVSTVAISVDATDKIYLDGGGNTYLYEKAADEVVLVCGGEEIRIADATGTGENTIFGLDAAVSLDTNSDANVFIGAYVADAALSGADKNVGIGWHSLGGLTTGDFNVCIGTNTGKQIDTEQYNNFIGYDAGSGAGAADNCVGIGGYALAGATTAAADGTVAIGHQALTALTSGAGNTAIGFEALKANVDGSKNTAVGYEALETFEAASSDEGGNTAVGWNALKLSDDGQYNTAIGHASADALLGGLSNTSVGSAALGSANRDESYNTVIGANAMADWQEGSHNDSGIDHNVAIGVSAFLGGNQGSANETQHANVAIGNFALTEGNMANTSHTGLVAVGYQALTSTLAAEGNTAVGYQAGALLTTGGENAIFGYGAMDATHVDSDSNTAIGFGAMGGTSTAARALRNTAVGHSAMGSAQHNGTTYNTAIGYSALGNITTGDYNTTVGTGAGNSISSGYENVLIGGNAGNNDIQIEDGYGNTIIGFGADASATNSVNCIGIGFDCNVTSSNIAMIGNGNITQLHAADDTGATLYAGSATVSTSDRRIKENFKDLSIGLDFINQLNPVEYNKKQPSDYEDSLKKNLSWYKSGRNPRVLDDVEKSKSRVGFIAQDVGVILKDLGFDDNNDIVDINDDTTLQHIAYSKIVVPLVKAVQELSAKVEELESKLK